MVIFTKIVFLKMSCSSDPDDIKRCVIDSGACGVCMIFRAGPIALFVKI